MLTHSHRSRIASIVMFALLLPMFLPSLAAARGKTSTPTQQETKDQNKKDKPAKDEKNSLSKQERKWLEVFKFSKQRYDTNPDFRLEVDEAYRRMQREHSEYAFSINAHDAKGELVKSDKYKVGATTTLYENPLAQDYVNRVGQSMVPVGSDKLYAFKIMLNPVPEARSLSTGTIYVSTGLLASIDNEAQLAYVLGHEIAHVEKEHWRDDVLVAEGLEDWNEKNRQQKERFGLITKVGLNIATMGMVNAGNLSGFASTMFADAAMPTIFKLAMPDTVVGWDRQQEDQADEAALRYMLDRKYDPREVPKFYAKLKALSQRDKRAGLGFIANAARIAEREPLLTQMIPLMATSVSGMLISGAVTLNMKNMQDQFQETVKAMLPQEEKKDTGKTLDPTAKAEAREQASQAAVTGEHAARIKELLDAGELIGSSAEFQSVMAAIRRDNGIRAFYYDMFHMARENLEESIRIRSNDPFAHYYYGVVLKLTARTLGEKQRALNEFALAVQYDRRKVLAEPYLHRALAMIDSKESHTREIVENLKEYVQLYQRQNAGALPPNMDMIYDYMQDAGEMSWTATPAMNVSTKNIDPIGVTSPISRTVAAPASEPSPVPISTQPPSKKPTTTTRRP
ncbi:MAG TPA: M48 family metalloprotease [Pyrinomonadaceae bacterium]|nr:M48 family metalloprotease [Pyrinomonadaceae bacterium]